LIENQSLFRKEIFWVFDYLNVFVILYFFSTQSLKKKA